MLQSDGPEIGAHDPEGSWVTLALLLRPWGRRGELAAESFSSGPERFEGLPEVTLFGPDGVRVRNIEIESVWQHRGALIFKFRGVDSISDAEKFARHEVRVPMELRAPLPEGEFYQSDLIGCEMVERGGGMVGVVTGWRDAGGPALLEVKVPGAREPMLVPFAKAICVEIDPAAHRIVVELPEGLKGL
ncbi:MAG TPA: ribosome maturation factor RimM [Bryobacteraceae bacterium]|nr:ribosome maturation factor RimM [Bryobacteraceae bacterium]